MSDHASGPGPADGIRGYFEERRLPEVVSVYLFGSEARGSAHRESDVDVGVLVDRARLPHASDRAELRVRLTSEVIGALHRNAVDLVILNDVPPGLACAVVLGGKRIFCADGESDREFVRDAQLRAADLEPFLRRMRAIKLERLRS
jgi:predicted nucleotidyltransferase